MKEKKLLKNLKPSSWKKKVFQEKLIFIGWKTKVAEKILNQVVEAKNVFQEKLFFSSWKTKSFWKILKPAA